MKKITGAAVRRIKQMIIDLVSDYVRQKKEYKTGLTLDDLCDDYVPADEKRDICKLNENENMFGTSPKAVEAMKNEAALCNFYPEGSGRKLRNRLAERFGIDPLNYLITDGASVALNLIGEVFIRENDEVIIPEVTYGAYKNVAARFGGVVVTVPNNDDQSIDLDGVLKAITDKTKLLFICNPNNPTGGAIPAQRLKKFLDKVPENVISVVDEAYIQYYIEDGGNGVIEYIKEEGCHTIIVRTFSKVYGMAGARIGYAVSSQEIIRALRSTANYFCANRVSIAGATAALEDLKYEKESILTTVSERKRVTEELRKMGYKVYDSAANFVYVDFKIKPSELCKKLEKFNIYLRGDFGCTRISIGRPEQNDRMLSVVSKELKGE